jgi:hypothetical protein
MALIVSKITRRLTCVALETRNPLNFQSRDAHDWLESGSNNNVLETLFHPELERKMSYILAKLVFVHHGRDLYRISPLGKIIGST